MKLIHIKYIIVLLVLTGSQLSTRNNISDKYLHTSTNINESHYSLTPVKIVVFADKSQSINNGFFPKLSANELEPIMEYIKAYGGELSLGLVQNQSRSQLETFRHIPLSVNPPQQRKGERASNYRQRLLQFHIKARDRIRSSKNVDSLITKFLTDANKILDYSDLEGSDICNAIDLAHLLLNERDDELECAKKVLIMVTDGWNTTVPCKWVESFPNTEFILVSRSGVGSNHLSRYNPLQQSSFAGALRIALN